MVYIGEVLARPRPRARPSRFAVACILVCVRGTKQRKNMIDMEEGLDVLLWFTLGRFKLVVKDGKKRLFTWHHA